MFMLFYSQFKAQKWKLEYFCRFCHATFHHALITCFCILSRALKPLNYITRYIYDCQGHVTKKKPVVGHGSPCLVKWKSRNITIIVNLTLTFPLSVLLSDLHTHCFQLVCGTKLAWLALAFSPFLLRFLLRFTFCSLNSSGPALPRGPFAPSVTSWTLHSLRSLVISLSLSSVRSLRSLLLGNARHSLHAIWFWMET